MSIREEINRLKKHLKVSTDRELAEILGTNKGNIDSWIKRDKIPEKWAIIIGQMYKNDTNNVDIPILKIDGGAGSGIHNFEPQQTIISLNADYFPFVSSGKSAVIEVVGDSMEPDLLDGDYIIILIECTIVMYITIFYLCNRKLNIFRHFCHILINNVCFCFSKRVVLHKFIIR